MDYYKYQINTNTENAEILLAFLGELPFDSFEQTDEGLNAYIPVRDYTENIASEMEQIKERFRFEYQRDFIKGENWNVIWESQFKPIMVDDFCTIRATFHTGSFNTKYEVVINPKMAFGTGHHATTFMMIQAMRLLDFSETTVFDYGCGTGILAILADKLGAQKVDAIDIDEEAYTNTIENIALNKVTHIITQQNILKNFIPDSYDIILANINRNVILKSLSALYQMLKNNGKILISGFIKPDQSLLEQEATNHGFTIGQVMNKDGWICMVLEKK